MQLFMALVVVFLCVSQLHAHQSSTIMNSKRKVCFNIWFSKQDIPKTQFQTELISVSLYPTEDFTEFPALDFKDSSSMKRDGRLHLSRCAETEANMTDMLAHIFVRAACTQENQIMGKGLTKSTTFTRVGFITGPILIFGSKEEVYGAWNEKQLAIAINCTTKEGENTLNGIQMRRHMYAKG